MWSAPVIAKCGHAIWVAMCKGRLACGVTVISDAPIIGEISKSAY